MAAPLQVHGRIVVLYPGQPLGLFPGQEPFSKTGSTLQVGLPCGTLHASAGCVAQE